METLPKADIRTISLKKGAKVALVFLLLNVIWQLVRMYRTWYVLESPLIPESAIGVINKPFIFEALVSAIASVGALILYFFDKFLIVIILATLVFIGGGFIYF